MAAPKIIVVGGGLAGLAAVIKIAEAGGSDAGALDSALAKAPAVVEGLLS